MLVARLKTALSSFPPNGQRKAGQASASVRFQPPSGRASMKKASSTSRVVGASMLMMGLSGKVGSCRSSSAACAKQGVELVPVLFTPVVAGGVSGPVHPIVMVRLHEPPRLREVERHEGIVGQPFGP